MKIIIAIYTTLLIPAVGFIVMLGYLGILGPETPFYTVVIGIATGVVWLLASEFSSCTALDRWGQ